MSVSMSLSVSLCIDSLAVVINTFIFKFVQLRLKFGTLIDPVTGYITKSTNVISWGQKGPSLGIDIEVLVLLIKRETSGTGVQITDATTDAIATITAAAAVTTTDATITDN